MSTVILIAILKY